MSEEMTLVMIEWVFIFIGWLLFCFSDKDGVSVGARETMRTLGKSALISGIVYGVIGVILTIIGN